MDALIYLLKRSAIKRFKFLFKNPATAISLSIFLLLLVVPTVISLVSGEVIPRNEYCDLIITGVCIFFGLIGFFSVFNNDRTSFFTLGEYNWVFPAPIEPKRILLYVIIRNVLATMVMYILLLMVLPRVIGTISIIQYLGICFAFSMYLLSFSFLYLWAFLLGESAVKKFRIGAYVLTAILMMGFAGYYLTASDTKDIFSLIQNFTKSTFVAYFPVFGWAKSSIVNIIQGDIAYSILFNLINLIPFIIAVIGILLTDRDYYEDTLKRAQNMQTIQNAVKKGNYEKVYFKNKKVKSEVKMKIKQGAAALFSKKLLEFRKSGFNFSKKSLLMPVIYIVIFSLLIKNSSLGHEVAAEFLVAILVFIVTPMSVNFDVKEFLTDELSKHYVYLIPEKSVVKGFNLTLIPFFVSLIKGIIFFSIFVLMIEVSMPKLFLTYLLYASLALVYIYGSLLTERIAGSRNSTIFTMMFRFIMSIVVTFPSIVVFSIISMVFKEVGFYFSIISISIVNLLFAGLLLFFSRKLFDVAELSN